MFNFLKPKKQKYSKTDVINRLGYVLENREQIIPIDIFLSEERYLAGLAGFSRIALRDELDYLVVFYVFRVLKRHGLSRKQFDVYLAELLEEFIADEAFDAEEGKDILAKMFTRIDSYSEFQSQSDIAANFLINVTNDFSLYGSDRARFCSPIMKTLQSNIVKIVG